MDNSNGSIGTGDAAVLALLADTARAGRGHWGGEGGYGYGFGPYTSPSALQHTLECARDTLAGQGQMQGQIAQQQALLAAIAGVNATVTQAEGRATDRIRDNAINSLRESSDLARQIAACCCDTQKGFLQQALEQAKCCCETQKMICEDGQKTRDLINQNALRVAVDQNNVSATVGAINAAASQNTAAIVAAIRESCSNHHHPH